MKIGHRWSLAALPFALGLGASACLDAGLENSGNALEPCEGQPLTEGYCDLSYKGLGILAVANDDASTRAAGIEDTLASNMVSARPFASLSDLVTLGLKQAEFNLLSAYARANGKEPFCGDGQRQTGIESCDPQGPGGALCASTCGWPSYTPTDEELLAAVTPYVQALMTKINQHGGRADLAAKALRDRGEALPTTVTFVAIGSYGGVTQEVLGARAIVRDTDHGVVENCLIEFTQSLRPGNSVKFFVKARRSGRTYQLSFAGHGDDIVSWISGRTIAEGRRYEHAEAIVARWVSRLVATGSQHPGAEVFAQQDVILRDLQQKVKRGSKATGPCAYGISLCFGSYQSAFHDYGPWWVGVHDNGVVENTYPIENTTDVPSGSSDDITPPNIGQFEVRGE